jgi:ADP-ribose pyrophosphatase YjhB (NUDIX family)
LSPDCKLVTAKSLASYRPNWAPTADAVLEHLQFGSLRHRVVVDARGIPEFDFPQLIEPGGAFCLPIHPSGFVSLISVYRPAVLVPCPQGQYPEYLLPDDFGVWQWEAPGGFREAGELPDAACRREVVEESGLTVQNLERVASIVLSSGSMPAPIDLYFATVSGTPIPQKSEAIREVRMFSGSAIRDLLRNNEIKCAITLSLLAHAFARGVL